MSLTKDISNLVTSVQRRIRVERKIVRKTVQAFLHAGFALSVNNGSDEDEIKPSTKESEVLEAMMETDDEYLLVFKNVDGELKRAGWVYFVYGNDGYDVISDYTTNHDEILKPINDYADKLEVGQG